MSKRKRYANWGAVEMAVGDTPTWPLPGVKPRFATWSFAGVRPFGCKDGACTRWHAGIDLIQVPDKTIVVATEAMEIAGVDRGWSKGAKAVTGRTKSGLFLVFGGTIRGSGNEFGIKRDMVVDKGQPLGRVKGSYGMIHFETYRDKHHDVVRNSNSPWNIGQPPPGGLLNPLNYVEFAAGRKATFANWSQRRDVLREFGVYPADSGPWGESDIDALIEAQSLLVQDHGKNLEPDGIWGPKTDEAFQNFMNTPTPPSGMKQPPSKPTKTPSGDTGSQGSAFGAAGLWFGGTALIVAGYAAARSIK